MGEGSPEGPAEIAARAYLEYIGALEPGEIGAFYNALSEFVQEHPDFRGTQAYHLLVGSGMQGGESSYTGEGLGEFLIQYFFPG